ncbi:formate dehydrogenase accessory sulfurtransferase FdhD [Rhodobacter capsulatus]|uniref:formate dehydrogenase accessory sulfurtransferase FdhD n=1 Tax=Rhodobacter capsulatus TaxID=1061 RepID=UPI0040262413
MMASPVDLEDFLLGFALTEGMIADRAELLRHEVVRQPQGIELRGVAGGARRAKVCRAAAGDGRSGRLRALRP